MNEKTYQLLESELLKYQIGEEAEDILLGLAEALADEKVVKKEVAYQEKIGKATVEIMGICEPDEEDEELMNVFVKWIKIEGKQIDIEDYIL